MNINIKLLVAISFTVIAACNNRQTTVPVSQNDLWVKQTLPDAYVQDLYESYIQNPQMQDHLETNIIIDYIIANGLMMTKDPLGYYYHIQTSDSEKPLYVFNDPIVAHYRGNLLTGKEFDSSYRKGEPLSFKLGQMIPAWNDLLKKMKAGDKAILITPSRLAYGKDGFPGYIAPNTVLKFELELLDQ